MLLNVDRSYAGDTSRARRYAEKKVQVYERLGLSWPDVLLPGGWEDTLRTFNLTGYGVTVIDSAGIVRCIDVPKRRLEALLRECGALGTGDGSDS